MAHHSVMILSERGLSDDTAYRYMDSSPSESTWFLDQYLESRKKPISFHQLLLVLLIEFSAHLPGFSITPFINQVSDVHRALTDYIPFQLVSELDIIGGDRSKTGYYVGLMVSASSCSKPSLSCTAHSFPCPTFL